PAAVVAQPGLEAQLRAAHAEAMVEIGAQRCGVGRVEAGEEAGRVAAEPFERNVEDLSEARRVIGPAGLDVPVPEPVVRAARGERVALLAEAQPLLAGGA